VAFDSRDRLPRTVLIDLPTRLYLLGQQQHLAGPSFDNRFFVNRRYFVEVDKLSRALKLAFDRPVVLDAAAIAERIDRAGYQTRVLSSTSDSDD